MKKTPLDLQKHFPKYHAYPRMSGGLSLRLNIPQDSLASRQDHDNVEATLVDWERGIVHCELIQYLLNLSSHSYK